MNVKKYDSAGKESGTIELPDEIFGGEINKATLYALIRTESRNRRQGTHKTKGFSDVHGGGRKPYKQKGTGNARQGSIRAAQFRGGFTVFGPLPRDYTIKLPEKQRKSGLRSVFQMRAMQNSISVMDDIKLNTFSTKTVSEIFKKMGLLPGNTVAYMVDSDDGIMKKSFGNIANVAYIHARRPTVPEMYYSGHLVITQSALDYIKDSFKTA
jgi:large subunit ribosomal protein L4